MSKCQNHFSGLFKDRIDSLDELMRDWGELKQFVTANINHLSGNAVMETLYSSYRSVSVLRLFPTSNAIIEHCFSTMLQVKTDWRNKLGAKSLEHLLRIKCAGPECVSHEFQRLLESSMDRYFRRKCRQTAGPMGQGQRK